MDAFLGVETPRLVAIDEGTFEGTHGLLVNVMERRSLNRRSAKSGEIVDNRGSFLKKATIPVQLRSYVSSYVQPDEGTSCERGQRVSIAQT